MVGIAAIALALPQQAQTYPHVNPDNTVTFKLNAPGASKVNVSVEGSKNVDMAKGSDGMWYAKTDPLKPDIYGYTFNVDGVSMLDPGNPAIKPNLIWVGNMVTVPGNPPEAWEVQNIPHGTVHHHFYHSTIIGDDRDYFVYTPAGFSARTKLPVLYLLHGFSDMASGWTAVGQAHTIFDNLIAQKKIKPMIVVMPLGYGVPGYASPGSPAFRDRDASKKNFERFRAALLEELKPAVEATYHTSTLRKDRAISGLSMGGAETLFTGLNNLDKFAYIGAFSSGGLQLPIEGNFPGLAASYAKNKPDLLWVSCGTEDGLIGTNRSICTWLKGQKVEVDQIETPGAHTWMVWRRNLIGFTQRIFTK